jgi:sarcosine oxidase
MANETCDVVVIGCGGFGSAALFHLACAGAKAIGIDQFHPPHDRGSSHGETRIIRKAYFEHPAYVPLLHRAWDLWEQLSSISSGKLLETRPLVMSGPDGSPVIDGAIASATLHKLRLEVMNSVEASREYPVLAIPENHRVAVEHTAGFLRAEECISTHLRHAALRGAQQRFGERVESLTATAAEVRVTTNRCQVTAGAAVITCGAWTGTLLPQYQSLISVRRKTLFWHPVDSPCWSDPHRSPIFLMDLPEGQFYGLPSVDGKTIKVGEHTGGERVRNPSSVRRETDSQDAEPVSRFVTRYLRHVDPAALRSAVCMYSDSPDGHFLFDRHPEWPIVIGAGFSGHGFKFTSVLGEAAAQLALNQPISEDLSFLSRKRLDAPA